VLLLSVTHLFQYVLICCMSLRCQQAQLQGLHARRPIPLLLLLLMPVADLRLRLLLQVASQQPFPFQSIAVPAQRSNSRLGSEACIHDSGSASNIIKP
jgi:hypothetical protein